MNVHSKPVSAAAELKANASLPFERARAMPKSVYTSEQFLAEEIEQNRPNCAVALGSGLGAVVMARAIARSGHGSLTVLDHDVRRLILTNEMLGEIGADARLIEAELEEYDSHNLWFPRHRLGRVPDSIDLLFIDGPGHFAGRTPRWPAGPELFPRLSASGVVVLDDGQRVKEKKALQRWAVDFPELEQVKTKLSGGAIVLRRR